MLNTDSLFNLVKEDNIVVANANDTLLNQKFRIYMTRKLMNNKVEVFATTILSSLTKLKSLSVLSIIKLNSNKPFLSYSTKASHIESITPYSSVIYSDNIT